ncbi:MAG: hypothetical protein ACK5KO_07700 [Arachnia sp.]
MWAEVLAAAVVALGFVVAVPVGTPVVRWLIAHVDRQADDEVAEDRKRLGLVAAQQELPGGRWIGLLERAAAYACLTAGFPAGIAVILAVKGLGRYADLRTDDRSTGELFIIGTFASMLWAAAAFGLAHGAVALLTR